jgi:hypothetical protein
MNGWLERLGLKNKQSYNSKGFDLTINGQTATLIEDKRSLEDPIVGPKFIDAGFFIGQMTDLNVWDVSLLPTEVQTFAAGCDETFLESRPPVSVKWDGVNMTELGNESASFELDRNTICSSLTGNV